MPKQILVPVSESDQIEQVLRSIEPIAQPGMKVVFFVHYGLSGFRKLMDQLLVLQGIQSDRLHSPNDDVLRIFETLRNRGLEMDVILYGCKLANVLQNYIRGEEEVDLVTVRPGAGHQSTRCGNKSVSFHRPFRASYPLSVCPLNSGQTVSR